MHFVAFLPFLSGKGINLYGFLFAYQHTSYFAELHTAFGSLSDCKLVASLNPSSSTYIALVKVFFFSLKVLIFFLFLYENICCDTH